MDWDKNTRPKRLRRKQKRLLLWLTFAVSFIFVSILGLFDGFNADSDISVITEIADKVLTEEEKRVVWDSMSEEGKEIIGKHLP